MKRIASLRESNLSQQLNHELREFQYSLGIKPVVTLHKVYIVGSVLTEDFQPEVSDIDIFLLTDEEPHPDVKENSFRGWDNTVGIHLDQEQMDFEPVKVDVVDIASKSEVTIAEQKEDPPHKDATIVPPYEKL